jgi:cell division protein FtsI/penicillin-binding protein 2
MRSRASRLWAGLAILTLLAGCTSAGDAQDEGPQDVLNEFVAAWNEQDFETMNSLMPDTPFRRKWHSGAMRVFFEKVLEDGRFTDFHITAEVIGEPTENNADAEFELVYESEATSQPVLFAGNLPLERTDEGWAVRWSRGLAVGGKSIDGVQVVERWPQRAAILDRDGKKIATGAAESRRYPFGSVAGTTVGHLEPPPKKGDPPDRLVGGSGLEAAYDEQLAGTPATTLKLVRDGKPLGPLGSKRGRDGAPLRTTLDMDVQRAAEAALGSTPGGAVVMDPATGDILAAVASSPFAPGNYVGVADIEPFNRALSGLYPPGSSMKAMTASAALDSGTVKPTTSLTGPKEYRGVRNFESGEFGTLSFAAALQNSVNTAFAQVALKLGADRLFRYAEAFGFNKPPTMKLQAATSSFPKPLDEGDLMWGSIGQAQVVATPLQMASVAATIANDGRRMEPRIDEQLKPTGERAIRVKTARTMHELMRNVVIGGTGVAANVTGLEVAGKTGTAEVDVGGERKNHAWFICFAPAPAPRVAIAIVAEYGGVGGEVAAPIARNILTGIWPHLPSPKGKKNKG